MKKVWLILVAAVTMIALMGCSMHYTKAIVEKLQPAELYESFDVKPINLKARSKCPSPPSVKIVNAETREDGIDMRPDSFSVSFPLNPKELTIGIVDYLKYGFKKSQIDVDESSPKTIKISVIDAKLERGVWIGGGNVQLRVEIPETRYVEFYSARDSHINFGKAMAYAIHKISRQVIDDPNIQDYILCR
jgi:hypothetical protein